MKDRYVLLTGTKKNAGDHLIAKRAKELLKWQRPDRDLVQLDRWRPLTDEELDTVNDSKALLLTGGPALQQNFYPGIYPLRNDLSEIEVPIITMGIGYKCLTGTWEETKRYQLNSSSIQLLEKIQQNGYWSSVRDYHTLNALLHYGFSNFIMTGCPALYENEHLGKPFPDVVKGSVRSIVFSVGTLYHWSKKLYAFQNFFIDQLAYYGKENGIELKALFHHGIPQNPQGNIKAFLSYLKKRGVEAVDISGDHASLEEEYQKADLHIGFRVHAHIYMSSMNKPSILFNEDGRGKGLDTVIGGLNFNFFELDTSGLLNKALLKTGLKKDPFKPHDSIPRDLVKNLEYEFSTQGKRLQQVRPNIDHHFQNMKRFLKQLP